MKIVTVVFLLILLSQSLGKHYLVKTKHHKKDKAKNNDAEIDELDMNTVDAKTLIYTVFKDNELDAFENLSVKTQIFIEGNINKIIDNVRNGKEDMDLNPIIDDLRQKRGKEIIENVKKGKGEDFKW